MEGAAVTDDVKDLVAGISAVTVSSSPDTQVLDRKAAPLQGNGKAIKTAAMPIVDIKGLK